MPDNGKPNPLAVRAQATTLKSGGLAPSLTLQDIKKTSVLQDVSSSFSKLFERFGLASKKAVEIQYAQCSDKGGRDYQEDAIHVGDVVDGVTLAVLSDGMGGHAAGDVAAKITVETIQNVLTKGLRKDAGSENIHRLFEKAVEKANGQISTRTEKDPETHGMGATVVAVVVANEQLHWLSIGDSPLYLWRKGKCYQINQDHSMAPAIDQMAKAGMLTEEEARVHPDRNCLTSAMTGKAPELIDVGNDPLDLMPNDLVVISSDGLQTLSDTDIASTLKKASGAHPLYIGAALLNSVLNLDEPEQDNIGIVTLKMKLAKAKKKAEQTADHDATDYGKTGHRWATKHQQ